VSVLALALKKRLEIIFPATNPLTLEIGQGRVIRAKILIESAHCCVSVESTTI
jgi:hypothetical protein